MSVIPLELQGKKHQPFSMAQPWEKVCRDRLTLGASSYRSLLTHGVVAQLGERLNGIQEVVSSILSSSTRFLKLIQVLNQLFLLHGDAQGSHRIFRLALSEYMVALFQQYTENICFFSKYSAGGLCDWGILLVIPLEFQGNKASTVFYGTGIFYYTGTGRNICLYILARSNGNLPKQNRRSVTASGRCFSYIIVHNNLCNSFLDSAHNL